MEKISTRKVFLISVLLTTVAGVFNLFLNRGRISTESSFNLPVLCIATAPISFISIAIVIIELSIILYFIVAAFNGFVHIKTIMRIVVRSLIWYPVINVINGFAVVVFKLDISKTGFYKMIYYIPFTLLVVFSIFISLKTTLNISKSRRIALSIIETAAISFLII